MKKYEQIELDQTCFACPQEYDAYYEGEKIGYLRLRHGFFYADYLDQRVYEANTIGDGIFDPSEEAKHLRKAKKAIWKAMTSRSNQEEDLKHVNCPQCKNKFRLTWDDYPSEEGEYLPKTLIIRGCPSGGIYDVSISCPHCDYEEDL